MIDQFTSNYFDYHISCNINVKMLNYVKKSYIFKTYYFFIIFTSYKQIEIMKIVANNLEVNKCKEVMNQLMICIKDKSISIQKRNEYYLDYLQLAKNLLILSR